MDKADKLEQVEKSQTSVRDSERGREGGREEYKREDSAVVAV